VSDFSPSTNYSTVTDCFRSEVLEIKNEMLLDDYKLNLSFTLLLQSSSLTNIHHYNYDQKKLYRLVKFLKDERGIGYRRISHILYDKGFRTIRSNKPIQNNYVYSIYKKGKIREERLSRCYDSQIQDIRCSVNFC
jgi:hypothetical protein